MRTEDNLSDRKLLTNEEIASKLLWPLWKGLDADYKKKYARNVWEQFENNLLQASYTSVLAKFFQSMLRQLPISLQEFDLHTVESVLNSGQDRHILRKIRSETSLLALYVRTRNEERKAHFAEAQEKATKSEDHLTEDAPDIEILFPHNPLTEQNENDNV